MFKREKKECLKVFESKLEKYGTSWSGIRAITFADIVYYKTIKIRNIQSGKVMKCLEKENYFISIFNYSIVALMTSKIWRNPCKKDSLALLDYKNKVKEVSGLMKDKNHDYNSSWKEMDILSFTDIIYMKALRLKFMYPKTNLEEFKDIANYSLMSLYYLNKKK